MGKQPLLVRVERLERRSGWLLAVVARMWEDYPILLSLGCSTASFGAGVAVWRLAGDRVWTNAVMSSTALFFVLYCAMMFSSMSMFLYGMMFIVMGNALIHFLGVKGSAFLLLLVAIGWPVYQQMRLVSASPSIRSDM